MAVISLRNVATSVPKGHLRCDAPITALVVHRRFGFSHSLITFVQQGTSRTFATTFCPCHNQPNYPKSPLNIPALDCETRKGKAQIMGDNALLPSEPPANDPNPNPVPVPVKEEEENPFPLTAVDKWVLSQTDEQFKYHSWAELRVLIQNNDLSVLKRKPSDLRRYMKWTAETKASYGSMTNYLLAHRLPKTWGVPPFTPVSDVPFAEPSDYCVLLNDWPYGFEPGITHMVVWTRTPIAVDDDKGDMTPESRKIVGDFVKQYFVDRLGPGGEGKVLYFKNWVALQSVRALEHVHVLVKDVDPVLIGEWTKEQEWHKA
ncbi:hypothetical protein GE21DRAFT_4516 [Neurospora crassa]|uniref:N-acetylglucosamine-induced protein 1 n=2 Tax=Neurospora crassa (strain ATCC 24698 / 74-OR23-1A / CBS 708.71 / DSM 1257 / FGSC 987) TaxID=367110 RepID=U9W359_NEUCR|nr:hypothetical protein NCU00215 [Neurospora crassa OR74A]ESA43306.1 hypothetical protein NCU00215 [Neurospora crassa OR74A]KHE89373.1 hypothetical protein GE21DRAFT_4516 [Neurospora crassa]|eukprot:XP_011393788.1 hypothetical protein NCU00215 [Neurospora crassa OR74A]